ncbi:MAG: hypothetical protein Q8O56_17395, partial [Solirubrobacteraceae bacterium]|nr:hypothetical protein [Solirubrobacteraceae bacterium]
MSSVVLAIALGFAVSPAARASAPAPAPCHGIAQIADPAGDGHHPNTDVVSGWLSEQAGRLQAVIRTQLGDWAPAHGDASSAGWAMLFELGGQRRYVRVEAPQRPGAIRFDHGTWTPAGGFVSAGSTSGAVADGVATATIDVPAATGAVAGTVLVRPFVLTYDGEDAPGQPHWVDRAPGATSPTEAVFGADYVVGACAAQLPGGPGGNGGVPATGPGSGAPGSTTTAVVLNVPSRLTGAGRVRA